MYICPECSKEFNTENMIVKHFLSCWKENHLNHTSNSAPHSADINKREDNQDILNFFNSFNQ